MASKKNRIVTLNIGAHSVSMATFRGTHSANLTLDKFESTALHGDPSADSTRIAQIQMALEGLIGSYKLKGTSLRYAISGQNVFIRFVKLPAMEMEKIEQVVEFEAQQNVPFPLDEVIWDYQILGENRSGEVEAVLVAVKADMLNGINEAVESCGLVVEGVDVSPMAMLNAFKLNYPDVEKPVLLLDIGARSTNMVFLEDGKSFTRTLPIGGSAVTNAIAKDMDISFADAEALKVEKGFVALGGAYEEHPDEQRNAISKVARTALTRLHAEVVRTINYYRSQMSGSAPQLVLLCGGGAAMAYTREFFAEKLNVDTDYFTSLRTVAVSDEELAHSGYLVGEHVGLALRQVHSCPFEINLLPDSVAKRKETNQRKPLLLTAAACLLGGLGCLAYFANWAAAETESQLAMEQGKVEELSGYASSIDRLNRQWNQTESVREPILVAITQRREWLEIIDELNRYFASDLFWVTDIQPLKDGGTYMGATATARRTADDSDERAGVSEIKELRIDGLWREDPAGRTAVMNVFNSIREEGGEYFNIDYQEGENQGDYLVISGREDEFLAWRFQMRLPLATPLPLPE